MYSRQYNDLRESLRNLRDMLQDLERKINFANMSVDYKEKFDLCTPKVEAMHNMGEAVLNAFASFKAQWQTIPGAERAKPEWASLKSEYSVCAENKINLLRVSMR